MRSTTRRTLAEVLLIALLVLFFVLDWIYISKKDLNKCIAICEMTCSD